MVRIILITKEYGKLDLLSYEFDKFIENNKYTLHSVNEPAYQEITDDISGIFEWYNDGELHRLYQPASYVIKSKEDLFHNINNNEIHNFKYYKETKFFEPILNDKIRVLYKPKCYINGNNYNNMANFLKRSLMMSRVEKINTIFEQ